MLAPTDDSDLATGERLDLRVRLGDALVRVVQLELGRGIADLSGAELVCELYRAELETQPLATPAFTVEALDPVPGQPPAYRISLSPMQVRAVAALAQSCTAAKRFVFWRMSLDDAAGHRRTLKYGRLTILIGSVDG